MRSLLLTMVTVMLPSVTQAEDLTLFITSFAAGEKGAVHTFSLDSSTGKLTEKQSEAGVEHPFYVAVRPDGRFLYSIHAKSFGSQEDEQVAAYAINGDSGELTLLNRQSARGSAACYLAVDSTGQTLLVANYLTGSVGSFPIRQDGSIGEMVSFVQHTGTSVNPARQQEPHAHCFVISPNNRFAYAADLGIDKIQCYRLDPDRSTLTANVQPFVRTLPGAGPRHLIFHPSQNWMYVINELANSVTHFAFDPETGTLIEHATVTTLPDDFSGVTHTADLRITPDGRFLYGTNRGHDSIASFRINEDGSLTSLAITPSLGKGPQNLLITPDGRLLLCANMPGNSVSVFRINADDGKLTSIGDPVPVTSPSCLLRLP